MPKAIIIRSGKDSRNFPSLASCRPLLDVVPSTASLMKVTLLPKCFSSANAVRSPNGGQPGGALIHSDALEPREMLSPQSTSFRRCLLRSLAIDFGNKAPAYFGIGPLHPPGSWRYVTSVCSLW